MKHRVIIYILVACLAAFLVAQPFALRDCLGGVVHAVSSLKKASEYQIKAVYLYNFLLFTKWPEDENSSGEGGNKDETVCIGILGRDPFGKNFADVEGEIVKSLNKKLVIKRYGPYRDGLDIEDCKVLFVSRYEKARFAEILKQLEGDSVLTVADTDGFLELKGMVCLVKVEDKIRWEINTTPLKEEGIQLSSQLMRSAHKIVEIPKLPPKK